jgi:hypothetical protein
MDVPIDEIIEEGDGYEEEEEEVPAPSDVPLDEMALEAMRRAAEDEEQAKAGASTQDGEDVPGTPSYETKLGALGLSARVPKGDIEKMEEAGILPDSVPSIQDPPIESTAPGSLSLSDLPTPALSTDLGVDTPGDGPSLAAKLEAIDEMGDTELDNAIADDEAAGEVSDGVTYEEDEEGEGAEEDDGEGDEGYEGEFDDDEGVDASAADQGVPLVSNKQALDDFVEGKLEDGEEPEKPLARAVADGVVSEEVAKKVVGEKEWAEEYADDQGFRVDGNKDDGYRKLILLRHELRTWGCQLISVRFWIRRPRSHQPIHQKYTRRHFAHCKYGNQTREGRRV